MKNDVLFIVDDEPMHAQMMADFLKEKFPSFTILEYKTGEECNENMDKMPSIIILDYHLNGIDKNARNGAEILEHIKKKYEQVEIIMISGQDKIDVAVDCMRLGAYDYVIKNETSFVRTQGAINRLLNHRIVVHNLIKYKRWYKILTWGIVTIILTTIILTITGVMKFK